MMQRCFCLVCNNFFTETDMLQCPHCNAVGDDIEICDDSDEMEEINQEEYDDYFSGLIANMEEVASNFFEYIDSLFLNRAR